MAAEVVALVDAGTSFSAYSNFAAVAPVRGGVLGCDAGAPCR